MRIIFFTRETSNPLLFFTTRILALVMILLNPLTGCQEKYAQPPEQPVDVEANQRTLKRGEYLVTTIGCADCHSPKRPGALGPEEIPELKLSGYRGDKELPDINTEPLEKGWILMSGDLTAAVGPWGISFASNLTSDETGIGTWSKEQFRRALKEGKFKGQKNGRTLLPPMPWQNFAHLTNEDIDAIFAYLQDTKPVRNAVPAPIPPDQISSRENKD